MSRTLFGVSLVSVLLSAGAWAQSTGTMRDSHAMNDMGHRKAASTTYVGCVQSVNHDAQFLLIHAMAGPSMAHPKAAGDTKMEGMKHDELILRAPSLDLRQYAGRQVSVTGSRVTDNPKGKVPAFDVESIKPLADRCE